MSSAPRRPAGSPTGGQFTPGHRAEACTGLAGASTPPPAEDWGEAHDEAELWWQLHCDTCPRPDNYTESKREVTVREAARMQHAGHRVRIVWEGDLRRF